MPTREGRMEVWRDGWNRRKQRIRKRIRTRSRCPPASRATRADKEKDKKEGFVESKGAVAVKDGGIGGRIRRRRRIRIRGEGEKGRRGEGEKEGQEEGEKEKDEWNVG